MTPEQMNPTPTPTVTVYDKNGQPYEADLVDGESYRTLERELAEAKAEIENLVWNLAGCDTLAMGYSKPDDFSKELARPALHSVSKLAAERDALRAEVERLRAQGVRGFTYEELEVLWDKLRTDYDKARARVAELEATISTARSLAYRAPELNMSNYDHEQVSQLNDAMGELFTVLDAALDAARGKGQP